MRLHQMITTPEAYVGILFVAGAGYRVGVLRDGRTLHYSAQAAWRMAREAERDDGELTDFAQALGMTAGRVRAMGLAGQEPHGQA